MIYSTYGPNKPNLQFKSIQQNANTELATVFFFPKTWHELKYPYVPLTRISKRALDFFKTVETGSDLPAAVVFVPLLKK